MSILMRKRPSVFTSTMSLAERADTGLLCTARGVDDRGHQPRRKRKCSSACQSTSDISTPALQSPSTSTCDEHLVADTVQEKPNDIVRAPLSRTLVDILDALTKHSGPEAQMHPKPDQVCNSAVLLRISHHERRAIKQFLQQMFYEARVDDGLEEGLDMADQCVFADAGHRIRMHKCVVRARKLMLMLCTDKLDVEKLLSKRLNISTTCTRRPRDNFVRYDRDVDNARRVLVPSNRVCMNPRHFCFNAPQLAGVSTALIDSSWPVPDRVIYERFFKNAPIVRRRPHFRPSSIPPPNRIAPLLVPAKMSHIIAS